MKTLDMETLMALSRISQLLGAVVAETVASEVRRRDTAGSSGQQAQRAEAADDHDQPASPKSSAPASRRSRSLECRLHSQMSPYPFLPCGKFVFYYIPIPPCLLEHMSKHIARVLDICRRPTRHRKVGALEAELRPTQRQLRVGGVALAPPRAPGRPREQTTFRRYAFPPKQIQRDSPTPEQVQRDSEGSFGFVLAQRRCDLKPWSSQKTLALSRRRWIRRAGPCCTTLARSASIGVVCCPSCRACSK